MEKALTPISVRELFLWAAVLMCVLASAAPLRAQDTASAKATDPDKAGVLVAKSLALLEQGESLSNDKDRRVAYTEGAVLAREAIELDKSNADAHFALFGNEGRLMLIDGVAVNPFNLIKINSSLDRCLELNPDHSDALAARGGMYRQLPTLLGGDLRKAEQDLKRSIELDPEATGARIELARTYHDMGEEEKVEPLLKEALQWAEKLHKERRVREAKQAMTEMCPK